MSFYKRWYGWCITHNYVRYVDLVAGKYWTACKDCGKRMP